MRTWLTPGWLALSSALCACSNDLDALFEQTAAAMQRRVDAGARVIDSGEVIAQYADLGEGGACVECMRQNCSDAERTCLADEACRDEALECAACRDPACSARCNDEDGYNLLEPLWSCMQASCSDDCSVGRHFECVDEFEWGYAGVPAVAHVQLLDYSTQDRVSGAEVRACDAARPTCEGTESVTTDEMGEAMLELVPYIGGRGFSGYVEILAAGFDRVIWYPSAGDSGGALWISLQLLSPDTYAATYALNGYEDDSTLGSVIILATDCLDSPAPGLSFSALPLSIKPPDSPWYGYPPDPHKTETEEDGIGGIVYFAPGVEEVTAVRAGTDDVVGKARVWAHPGTRTWLFLKPLGKTQL